MVDFFWVYIGYALAVIFLGGFFIYFTNVKYRGHFANNKSSLWSQIKKFKQTYPKEGLIIQVLLFSLQCISLFLIAYIYIFE